MATKRNGKSTKIERAQQKKEAMDYYQAGTGLYLFRNRTSGSLELPKVSKDGKKWVEPGCTWEGDSYFLSMIPKEATLVRSLEEPKKEEIKMEEKLILDQPEQITKSGKVEHVSKDGALNENPQEDATSKDRLLTEDPLAGVTILRD
jgi:hypothetical protein